MRTKKLHLSEVAVGTSLIPGGIVFYNRELSKTPGKLYLYTVTLTGELM